MCKSDHLCFSLNSSFGSHLRIEQPEMGCISSKMRLRSGSFRDELNQRFQISDRFHSLVHNGKDTLPSESNYCSKPATEVVKVGTEWETMTVCSAPGVEKNQSLLLLPESMKTESTDYKLRKQRSKSCHCFEDLEVSDEQNFEGNSRYVLNLRNNSVTRARSFHTVEEFDELVERNLLSSIMQQLDDDPGKNGPLQNLRSISPAEVSLLNDSYQAEQNLPEPEDTATLQILQSRTLGGAAKENKLFEKGSKRKAIAMSLESLTIPQSIEFPSLASVLKEKLNVGKHQISSPGEYVTPKFGSYTKKLPLSQSSSFCKEEGDIFDSELMAAFEECMEQLEEEEEMVLKQIEETLNE